MARKPYVTQQPDNWYRLNPYYTAYMLRELTSVPVALVALNLFWGLISLAGEMQSWIFWINFQRSPLMVLFNFIAIIAALYNSITWFKAMPKAVRIQRGDEFLSDKILVFTSWIAFSIVFLILLIIVIMTGNLGEKL